MTAASIAAHAQSNVSRDSARTARPVVVAIERRSMPEASWDARGEEREMAAELIDGERDRAGMIIRPGRGWALYCAGPGAPVLRITSMAEWDAVTRRPRRSARD